MHLCAVFHAGPSKKYLIFFFFIYGSSLKSPQIAEEVLKSP